MRVPGVGVPPDSAGQRFPFLGEIGQTLAATGEIGFMGRFPRNQIIQFFPTCADFGFETGQQGARRGIAKRVRVFRRATDRTGRACLQIFPQGLDALGASDFGGFQRFFRLFQPGGCGRFGRNDAG